MSHVTRFEGLDPAMWGEWVYQHPTAPRSTKGKLFLGDKLGLRAMEISINSMRPGGHMPFVHRHRENEEVYLFLSGRGEMTVDGETFEVSAGSAVRIAPEGARTWRNVGDEPLVYVVIQASLTGGAVNGISDGMLVQ